MASKSVSDFLSGLPSKNPDNFKAWPHSTEFVVQDVTRKPAPYMPTKDTPSVAIVNEHTKVQLPGLLEESKRMQKQVKKANSNEKPPTEQENLLAALGLEIGPEIEVRVVAYNNQ